MARDTFTVAYRVGTSRDDFQWRRSFPIATREQAADVARTYQCCGSPTKIYRTSQLDSIGLPETFDSSDPVPGNTWE